MRYLALVLLLGILAGCGSKAVSTVVPTHAAIASPTQTSFALTVNVTAAPANHSAITGEAEGSACGDYQIERAPIVVRDEHGTVLATGATGANVRPQPTPVPDAEHADIKRAGLINAAPQSRTDEAAYFEATFSCQVSGTITLPRAQFYQITVGTHGVTPYGFDQLQQLGWRLALTLP